MRSRSSSTLRASSVAALLCLACETRADPRPESDIMSPTTRVEEKADSVADEGTEEVDVEASTSTPEIAEDPQPRANPADVVDAVLDAACPEGHLWFDGRCTPKKTMKKALEKKDDEVLAKVKNPGDVRDSSDASTALIEQQIVQARKSEDDLDEIIRILEQRQDKGAEAPRPEGP